jgi:hypothetical protein
VRRKVIEQYPGGPTVDVPEPYPRPWGLVGECSVKGPGCEGAVIGDFNVNRRPACRVCYWKYLYATTELVPPGMEQGGSGI